jgi:hypothetical protein
MVNIAFTVNPDDQAASRAVSGGAGKAWFTGRQAEPAEITALPDQATCSTAASGWQKGRAL